MPTDVNLSSQPAVVRVNDFATEAADFVMEHMRAAIAARGLFRFGLAGGNTPRVVYENLAGRADIPWSQVQITFADERCVGLDDKDSNYNMANVAMLSKVPIPEGNVFRMRGEIDPAEAAAEYEAKLAAVAARFGEERYRHDLILLGMGEDGHTASLFPGSPGLNEMTKNVVPNTGPKPPPQRLTFTFPLLNAARQICFLVTPKGKEQVLESAIAGDQQYPSARVRPVDGKVTWMIGK
jgi:6-phosphogluconolactonase